MMLQITKALQMEIWGLPSITNCNYKRSQVKLLILKYITLRQLQCSAVLEVHTQVIICQIHAMSITVTSYIGECSESCIFMYEKILTKLVEYKNITPSSADVSKLLYHNFLSTVVKENKEELVFLQ